MKKTLTTVLLFAGMASAWASGLPDGIYKGSCKDISMVGNTLHAKCGAPWYGEAGPAGYLWNETTLDNANTCAAVENQRALLVCLRQK